LAMGGVKFKNKRVGVKSRTGWGRLGPMRSKAAPLRHWSA
jgi:hypothetical protein